MPICCCEINSTCKYVLASIGESKRCRGGQRVASGKRLILRKNAQCPGDTENTKAS